ncbi:MAG TPA: polysaccharide deacetylase family protein [Bacteroidales bacterium]|nr:polysaccharide deacetylase family protein [Bacteroidales bacterium]
MKKIIVLFSVVFLINKCSTQQKDIGETEISRWQFGKKGAVSITWDDGSINQFRIALPILNRLKIPATFYIITGHIPGSQYQPAFIGRPVKTIIKETATIPTNKENFYERSSAAGFLGYQGTVKYHTDAGIKIDGGKPEEAYTIIDELYKKVRNGDFPSKNKTNPRINMDRRITWDEIRSYAAQGHEFASHTVSHPYLSALDNVNMMYELEKSREDILNQLGKKYTFSATIPYASKEERVLNNAYKVYPAIRTKISQDFMSIMDEFNTSDLKNPDSLDKEYAAWQCRAFTRTTLSTMKSWIDTTASYNNIWQIIIFHGVDGIGYEPLSSELLDEYFRYMKSREDDLWIATYADVAKYIGERMNSSFKTTADKEKITINLTNSLDQALYDIPLTLKTYVPSKWKEVQVNQGTVNTTLSTQEDSGGKYLLYQAYPNTGNIELKEIKE